MDINDYQARAADTVQFEKNSDQAITISLLGLSGEVGELSTEYKKKIRDGESYKIFREKIIEEIGDIMWYLSYIATHEDIEFSEILEDSLKKITSRWENLHGNQTYLDLEREFFDDGFPEENRFQIEAGF
ncbi:MAG: nucleoside triphosphate pyrophosphohydrolase family protein [Patescibacteria group bacterium]